MASRPGISSLAATLFVGLVLTLAALFLWRVWVYYGQISRGETTTLPQFDAQFTPAGAGNASANLVADVATTDDPALGPAGAPLTVVEFLDYGCPFSGAESSVVRELAAAYSDRVHFVIRDFPVEELHPNAVLAAEAAGCAEAQGKFWPMHDRLFALRGSLARTNLDRAAEQSGLDLKTFAACMDSHARLDEIQADVEGALAAGVRGTPTFFFNGQRVEGAIPRDAFETLIRKFAPSP